MHLHPISSESLSSCSFFKGRFHSYSDFLIRDDKFTLKKVKKGKVVRL